MSSPVDLSLNEWSVLGLVAEHQTHGFAVSREFAHDASLGRIWTIPRPLVYRAVAVLTTRGLVREIGAAPGVHGPERRMIEATPDGRAALRSWLALPVAHVRDARSELLVKLQLLDRSGDDPLELLVAQAAQLEPLLASRREQLRASEGFSSTLARWRLYSTEAVERFIAEQIEDRRRSLPGTTGGPHAAP